jgi:hypothetical protein
LYRSVARCAPVPGTDSIVHASSTSISCCFSFPLVHSTSTTSSTQYKVLLVLQVLQSTTIGIVLHRTSSLTGTAGTAANL